MGKPGEVERVTTRACEKCHHIVDHWLVIFHRGIETIWCLLCFKKYCGG